MIGVPSDPIDHLNAALTGRYHIHSALGEGGMATVYLADDLRHGRKVAVKVLRPDVAALVGAERFLTEIQTTANLQHPHILPLHDSGDASGFLYYVMPYVQGESLQTKLEREHQLAVDEAVRIATALASALDYAHRQGMIHRDIKPANILMHDGEPMLADFGIARALSGTGGKRLTELGTIVGTPQYMSPEQVTGDREVGPASDLWALGCVLYEMLTGEPPYKGANAQAVLGAILADDPKPTRTSRKTVPLHVDAVIARSLEKLPADRFARAKDFAIALGNPGFRHTLPVLNGKSQTGDLKGRVTIGATAFAAGLSLAIVWMLLRSPSEDTHSSATFPILPPLGHQLPVGNPAGFALSSDGGLLAFTAYDPSVVGQSVHPDAVGPGMSLFIRSMNDLEPRRLDGTIDGRFPFFSPDGQWLGFWQDGMIRKIAVTGGPVVTVVAAPVMWGASWSSNNYILFGDGSGIARVLAEPGNSPTRLATAAAGTDLRYPFLMPDGKTALVELGPASVTVWSPGKTMEIASLSLASGEVQPIGIKGRNPRFLEPSFLLYTAEGWIHRIEFDPRRRVVNGTADPVFQTPTSSGGARFAVARTGTLVYLRDIVTDSSHLEWVARDGVAERIYRDWSGGIADARLSPDGKHLTGGLLTGGREGGIWVRPLPDGPVTWLVSPGALPLAYRPYWSPDGTEVLFHPGPLRRHIGMLADIDTLFAGPIAVESLWSSDGRWLVYRTDNNTATRGDIRRIDVRERGVPVDVVATSAEEVSPALSPNDQWLAYVSDQEGKQEVYVQSFSSDPKTRIKVSLDGGTEPVWARSGRELFYRDAGMNMIALEVVPGPQFTIGSRRRLFSTAPYKASGLSAAYDVSLDGRRFLMTRERRVSTVELILVQDVIRTRTLSSQ